MLKIKSLKLCTEKNIKYDLGTITCPKNIFEIANKIGLNTKSQEYVYILCLDNSNNINCIANISIGEINKCVCDNRIIFQYMYLSNSTKMILLHNHPSNKLNFSSADVRVTKHIEKACNILDFELLDHILITENDYLSIRNEKLI